MKKLLLSLGLAALAVLASAQSRVGDLIYLHQGGVAFTMDEFKPAKPNGIAVLWMVSGGWYSDYTGINPALAKPLTDAGITVFEVVHGSQPRYKIHEIEKQITRAVRYVRTNAATLGIDPNRIGITGGSAGGHLSLMAAGLGDDGNPTASDPVEKASSKVQSVVAYFPPADFLHWIADVPVPVNAPQFAPFRGAFGVEPTAPLEMINGYLKEHSPIYRVTPAFPPTLLIHGDKDALVPLDQSKKLDAKFAEVGVKHRLIVVPGAVHGADAKFIPTFKDMVDWFLTTLPAKR